MDPPARDLRHRGQDHLAGDRPFGAHPDGAGRALHRGDDMEVGKTAFEPLELVAEHEFLGRPCAVEEEDITLPRGVGEIAQHRHHRGDADPARDQHDALGIRSREGEGAERSADLQQIVGDDLVVQVSRDHALLLALDRQFDIGPLGRRRGDRVGTARGLARFGLYLDLQELARQEVERQPVGGRVREPEGQHARRLSHDLDHAQLPRPAFGLAQRSPSGRGRIARREPGAVGNGGRRGRNPGSGLGSLRLRLCQCLAGGDTTGDRPDPPEAEDLQRDQRGAHQPQEEHEKQVRGRDAEPVIGMAGRGLVDVELIAQPGKPDLPGRLQAADRALRGGAGPEQVGSLAQAARRIEPGRDRGCTRAVGRGGVDHR